MISKDKNKIKDLLSRGVEEIIDEKNLRQKLLVGKKLRIKHGIDPTSDKLHLGHAIALWKLRQFQQLGHQVVLILGDFTAQIGDPSDKLERRPFLSQKQITKNLKTYRQQIGKILDIKKVEWHRNSQWFERMTLTQFEQLARLFSVQQMLARRNFSERLKREKEILVQELHYPLYQGYDSVMVRADIEIGGSDQLFNLLAAREVQKEFKQKPQDILTLKMIEGLDGQKMSKTANNVVNIIDPSSEQYGKIMSMHDDLIVKYFELCTQLPLSEIEKIKKALKKGANPRHLKARLAKEIVALYYGKKSALKAEKEFNRIFKEKKLPAKIPVCRLSARSYKLIDLLVQTKLAPSKAQARRLIEQGGVRIIQNSKSKVQNNWKEEIKIKKGIVIQAGKRRFIKLDT